MRPKLVMSNIFTDLDHLRTFAREHGFSGIDWSFDTDTLPATPAEESRWVEGLSSLEPFELRYHCPFYQMDLGHDDPSQARAAETLFRRIIHLVSKANGRYLTIHIGLGHDSTEPLSWGKTLDNLTRLVQYGATRRVRICLENLAWGWTSRPNLFEKLIRKSGAGVTFDIGHAYSCESIRSHQYAIEDFAIPHSHRVFSAHIYHTEAPGLGHIPPDHLETIKDRLALLQSIGCDWWVIEMKEAQGLLQTKMIIDEYLAQVNGLNKPDDEGPAASLT